MQFNTLKNGLDESDKLPVCVNRFSAREVHPLTAFDNKLWVIGGHEKDYSLKSAKRFK